MTSVGEGVYPCFAIRRGQARGKAEVDFWLPMYQENERRVRATPWPVSTVGSLALQPQEGVGVKDGPGGWSVSKSEYVAAGVPIIRATNVSEDGIDLGAAVFITEAKHQELSATSIQPDDLLLTMRGSIGRAAVVPRSIPRANMNAAICRIRLRDRTLNPYVRDFLNTGPGRRQSLRHGHKAVQGDLNLDAIRSFIVPLPPPEVRNRLVLGLEDARAARRKRTADAEELLAGLDRFVLRELGLPDVIGIVRGTTYGVRLREVIAGRKLYPDYFHPERIKAIKAVLSIYPGDHSATLASIAVFCREQRSVQPGDIYLGLADVQSNTGERIKSTDEDGVGTVFEYAEGDILFARLRPYLNKVYRAESAGVCSPEFHVIRVRRDMSGTPLVDPDYLAAVLRSGAVLAQTRHMMTGNTHPRLANEDVAQLVVPIPGDSVQTKIGAEVVGRRIQARRLRDEAEALWDAAKANFEVALLGPGTTVGGGRR